MTVLLKYAILIEPDRQRLAKFIFQAVEKLGGNVFSASATLLALSDRLLQAYKSNDIALEAQLGLADNQLTISWNGETHRIVTLENAPSAAAIELLKQQLKHDSESADPGLLRVRNEKISSNLKLAKQRAAAEMAELEALLEKKKRELWITTHQAETDSLTGLFNRGAYDRKINEAVARCLRQKEPLCLILLDLDNFKEINDRNGHQCGDEYLKQIAHIMRRSCRDDVDSACRIGGDEFAIIAFARLPIAERMAKKILAAFDRRVSIGLTELAATDDVKQFIARSDAALYKAKELGRGQVMAA